MTCTVAPGVGPVCLCGLFLVPSGLRDLSSAERPSIR